MSDFDREDRGTYSPPTEDNLSYEPRRTPSSRDQAPVTLIVSGICLVVLLLVVVILYNSGLNKHGKIAPEVGDSIGDIKEGQVQDAKPLSDQDMNDTSVATFTPGSEVPGQRPAPTVDVAPAPAAPITGPLPSQASNSALSSASVAPAPAATSASSASSAAPVAAATSSSTPPLKLTSAAATGAASVQIGAFTSTDIANSEYAKVASSYGLFVGGAGKKIEKVTTPNGTFYRTAFTGLTSEKAKSFCSALKAAGHDCIVK
ncbi:SPOR domain-containing protein [Asticcacaulis sp. 201]|uniref:SPOR domain-containing protein n=1 Tax=Asticcacaulis sp. 201 TaxID=3028787 RepID=UPI0029167EB0|nr:SPOR domain-containing protein [Asticcacaulis sp. 201]MDV6329649.1 SPOR domain-containing protein [Asticcacaulis sp. 201]